VLNFTNVTPIHLTLANLTCAIAASLLFFQGTLGGFFAGAIVAQIGFLSDSLDGSVARLKGTGTPLGALLDSITDYFRVVLLLFSFTFGVIKLHGEESVALWSLLLACIYFGEAFLSTVLKGASRFYSDPIHWPLGVRDRWLLSAMQSLEQFKLRLVIFGFNEREALIFFIFPILGLPYQGLIVGTLLAIPFLGLRFFLDLALMKQSLQKETTS